MTFLIYVLCVLAGGVLVFLCLLLWPWISDAIRWSRYSRFRARMWEEHGAAELNGNWHRYFFHD